MTTTVTTKGPLFDGRAAAAVRAYLDEAEREVAEFGVNEVRTQLDHVLKHPTGHYRGSIRDDPSGGHEAITDGGIIYGPWLEGVGSRNATTRFKGYATFRKTTQRIQTKAAEIADRVLHKYLGRMQ